MKVFQTIKKNFCAVGIGPNLALQTYPLNIKILMGFFILGTAIICMMVYIIRDAKTFSEYTQSLHLCSLSALIVFILLIVILKVENLFNLMNTCDELTETSELKSNESIHILKKMFELSFNLNHFMKQNLNILHRNPCSLKQINLLKN